MSFALISDPQVTSIEIVAVDDPLIRLTQSRQIMISRKRQSANPGYDHVRSAVLEKLLFAAQLLPAGVVLCLEEGYRPVEVQRVIYETYLQSLRENRKDIGEAQLAEEATKYVASPEGTPPHSTGGALDITLFSREEEAELDMGSSSDDTPLLNGTRNYTYSTEISETAKQNRAILSNAMLSAGFVNYPAEWWHWSYGDQYWAYMHHCQALYGTLPWEGL